MFLIDGLILSADGAVVGLCVAPLIRAHRRIVFALACGATDGLASLTGGAVVQPALAEVTEWATAVVLGLLGLYVLGLVRLLSSRRSTPRGQPLRVPSPILALLPLLLCVDNLVWPQPPVEVAGAAFQALISASLMLAGLAIGSRLAGRSVTWQGRWAGFGLLLTGGVLLIV